MQRFRFLLQGHYLLLGVAGVLFLVLMVLIIFAVAAPRSPQPQQPIAQPSPVQQQESRAIPTPPSSFELTSLERSYPQATPQPFFDEQTNKTGILVVTTNVPDVRVSIDQGEGETSSSGFEVPIQTAPFRTDEIPVGAHIMRAGKEGYVFYESFIVIQPGQITRVALDLEPIR